jgi:HEAT repeat protein
MLQVVIWVGVVVFALTLLLVLQIMLLRALLILRQRRSARFLAVWRPLLMQSLEAVPAHLPAITPADAFTFLSVWNYLHDSLLATTKDHLNQLARALEMDKVAQQMLRQRSIRPRLMAIVTLGHLRETAVWEQLQTMAQSQHTVLALAAARAVVQINASEALPWLLPLMAERTDWSVTRVVTILKEAGAEVVSQPLATALLTIAPEHRPRLIRYLEVAHRDIVLPTVRQLLRTSPDEQVLQACLQFINAPEDVESVRTCLTHPQWVVRVQAAAALGRIGAEADQPRLVELLNDSQWWVRYRAAQSLVNWPFSALTQFQHLAVTHANPFAREILTQALAERRMMEEQRR